MIPRALRPWIESVACGAILGAIAIAYVNILVWALAGDVEAAEEPEAEADPPWLHAIELVVLAPVIEEWLCRGVLWAAVRRIVAVRGAILVTAVLFALMHGLQGPALVALPHRFLGGIAFGWLRARFGSLLPCMLAHATVNGLVLAMNTA